MYIYYYPLCKDMYVSYYVFYPMKNHNKSLCWITMKIVGCRWVPMGPLVH